jgi:hypothetical protein
MGAGMLGRTLLIAGGVWVAAVSSQAAIPKANVTPARILHSSGVAMGGKAGGALSLMDFRRSTSPKSKMERFVLDFGGADMKEAKGLVGYYHAELQENPSRLVLELPQTFASLLPEKEILKRLEKSLYVKRAQIGFDRNLQSMTLIFELKRPVQARVARVDNPETSGKIVIDLLPENPAAKRRAQERERQAALRARQQLRRDVSRTTKAVATPQRTLPAKTAAKNSPALSRAVSKSQKPAPTSRQGTSERDRKAAASIQSQGANR